MRFDWAYESVGGKALQDMYSADVGWWAATLLIFLLLVAVVAF